MTPAIKLLQRQRVIHQVLEYPHDPCGESYGMEAASKLGVDGNRVFKTLVVSLDDQSMAVAVVPVTAMLSMKRMAQACGAKRASMADKAAVQRSTGYVPGGISPLAQKRRLKTILDASAQNHSNIYVSAGRRGLEIRLNPDDLRILTGAQCAAIRQ